MHTEYMYTPNRLAREGSNRHALSVLVGGVYSFNQKKDGQIYHDSSTNTNYAITKE